MSYELAVAPFYTLGLFIFIERQHMHTERDIVLAYPSVRPSVRLSLCMSHTGIAPKRSHIFASNIMPPVILRANVVTKFQGELP